MDKQKNSTLVPEIVQFFKSITNNQGVINLAREIQIASESGHSAITGMLEYEHDLISQDGSHGYIVQTNGKSGFRRLYNDEIFIRNNFLSKHAIDVDLNRLQSILKNVVKFNVNTEEIDWQWQAAISALFHSRFILSGGPGTGKTTAIIKMLLLYLQLHPDNSIALAAPTGKAANRMVESIRQNIEQSNISDEFISRIPKNAVTIHRLLKYKPRSNRNFYNNNNHLPYNLIIIDEASMLDISMMCTLLKALKPNAQLILLGDKNQLPAVDVGNVFADLCNLMKNQSGYNLLNEISNNQSIITSKISNFVELKKNYRFADDSVIFALCESIILTDYEKFAECRKYPHFTWKSPKKKSEKSQFLNQWVESHQNGETSMLLAATNSGENSVKELNQLSREVFHDNFEINEGMPVLVTQNDYTLGIFNGDIGFISKKKGQWYALFNIQGKQQYILLDAIKNWQLAHAISIHKSQGSEYDHVLITIADNIEEDFLNRELLYTAVSRAKKTIQIWCSENTIKTILKASNQRITFLSAK